MTNNKTILAWIDEMKALVNPDQVVWIDGSEEQLEELRKEAVESGEMIKLNQEKLPGCYYHRTAPNDVARVEDRTLICSRKEEDAGRPTIGKSRRKHTRCCTILLVAATRAVPCTLSRTPWARRFPAR